MERIEGVEARGEVIFTVQNALLEELSIPAGTIVTAENGMEFETITDNILPAGALSIPCMVEAIEVGADGNIPANSIITKIDGYDAVQGFTVSNEDAFSGGLDYEEDDVFRDRIIEHMSLQKVGSEPYYKATLANEYPEAHDILFDTSSSTYTAVITPNTYKGSEAQLKLVNDIHAFLSDANNILLGHSFNVVSPQSYIKTVNIYFQDTASSNNGLYVKLANYDTDTVCQPARTRIDDSKVMHQRIRKDCSRRSVVAYNRSGVHAHIRQRRYRSDDGTDTAADQSRRQCIPGVLHSIRNHPVHQQDRQEEDADCRGIDRRGQERPSGQY
jgi:hypothetical protein